MNFSSSYLWRLWVLSAPVPQPLFFSMLSRVNDPKGIRIVPARRKVPSSEQTRFH